MKINKTKKGFTLPEVIIAVTLVALIIVTATNLLVSSMRANRTNINHIIAYGLASEGIEAVRNIRDGYWMNNIKWTGETEPGRSDRNIFGDEFGTGGYFIMDKNHTVFIPDGCAGFDQNTFNFIRDYAPWKLTRILSPDTADTQLYLKDWSDVREYTTNATGAPSGFSRWIYIEPMEYKKYDFGTPREDLKIYVAVTIEWEELSAKKSITIPTHLTDWKAGPF